MTSVLLENPLPHPFYTHDQVNQVQVTHREPHEFHDRVAYYGVGVLRRGFDFVSRFKGPGGGMTAGDWLHRLIFLEAVAGVPGMVAATLRHLRAVRNMEKDHGWIHTHLEEAENERMHLLIFMTMKDPGMIFRLLVKGGQAVFFSLFLTSYLLSPTTCHRFIGYMEEQEVYTYTMIIQDIEDGHLGAWKTEPAPPIAREYYHLAEHATILDVIKRIRADEAHHRDVNHKLANLDWATDANPVAPCSSGQ